MKRSVESSTTKSLDDRRSQKSRSSEERPPEMPTTKEGTTRLQERTEDFLRVSSSETGEPSTQRAEQALVLTVTKSHFRRSLDLGSRDLASTSAFPSTRPDFHHSLDLGSRVGQPHPFGHSSEQQDTSLSIEPVSSPSMPVLPLYQRRTSDVHSSGERVEASTSRDAGDRSQSDRNLVVYTERVIKDVKIPEGHRDNATEHIKILYEMVKKSRGATSEDDYMQACRDVLSHVPKEISVLWWQPGRTTGEWFGQVLEGDKKTRLETVNIRTRGNLEVERRKSKFARVGGRITNETAWRLNKPKYRFALAVALGVASTLTPLAYSEGKFEPIAIPINVGATYADTAIFKATSYPWNLVITSGLWQGSGFVTAYAQKGIDNAVHQNNGTHGNLTNTELASLLAEPFGNLTVGNSTIDQLLAGRLEALSQEGLIFGWSHPNGG